ncbi:MAG TPA: Hpt domain-containing protein [Burkholderiaceae bacterium]|nr:Hpt domain-containing protein [Burkholderiaceae bacterium]
MPDSIDRAVFSELQQTAGADFVVELVDTFAEEAPGMFAELRAAYTAGAAERFRRAAHSLKTNANTFGATALGTQARELELGGLPAGAAGIDALQALFDATVPALKELARG